MPDPVHYCSTCGAQWTGAHSCPPTKKPPSEPRIINLMDALKQSIEEARKKREEQSDA